MKLQPHYPVKYGFDGKSPPPVPEACKKEGHFSASFDRRLWMFHRRWEPADDQDVKATLMIVHGTVDHSGVYSSLAHQLVNAGIAVIAMDMRGWGLSDGESMYLDDMDTFVQDVVALHEQIHSLPRYENVRSRFLMGKSIGGLVTAFCVAMHPKMWTGLLGLSGAYAPGPGLKIPSPFIMPLVYGAGYLCPKTPVKPLFDDGLIVSDAKALQEWRDDELCCKDKVRLGYGIVGIQSLKELSKTVAAQLDLPMFMMCGEADKVVTMEGHQFMIDKNRNIDKKLKFYRGGFHNLLQEPTLKAQVMIDIQQWILAHAM